MDVAMRLAVFVLGVVGAGLLLEVVVHAFKRSTRDGLLSLFVPFYLLYYLYMHYPRRRQGVVVTVTILALAIEGFLATRTISGTKSPAAVYLLMLMARSFTVGFGLISVGGLICVLIVLRHAFRQNVKDGLLSLLLPFYFLYYMFLRFTHPRRREIVALAFAGPAICIALGAMASWGLKRRWRLEREAEGRVALGRIGKLACAYMSEPDPSTSARPIELPPNAPPVPASLSLLRGEKYKSKASDWTGTWELFRFSMVDPQRFQYEWERISPTQGMARATADLDGDGALDARFELAVDCRHAESGLECHPSRQVVEAMKR